jgi:hypothetical protein
LQIEAEAIWLRARNIRKPPEYPDHAQVAYYYQGWNHKFGDLRVVATGCRVRDELNSFGRKPE